jgi:hypothetical protein
MPTSGKQTSEFELASAPNRWGIVALVLGGIITIGSQLIESLGSLSYWGIIAGAAVAIATEVRKTLIQLGYIKSRTELKKEGKP